MCQKPKLLLQNIFDDILKFSYVVSHPKRCMCTHVLTNTYYDISWLLSALTSHQ